MKHRLLLGLLAVMFVSCQVPFQPEDLTTDRTITVNVIKEPDNPVKGARVDWQKTTGQNAPMGGTVATGADGQASVSIPNVALTRDSVRMLVTMPPDPDLSGIEPIRFAYAVCNDTTIDIRVQRLIACGTVTLTDSFAFDVCPTEGTGRGQSCKLYPTNCPSSVVFTATTPANPAFQVVITPGGTTQSAVQVCVTYAPSSTTPSGTIDTSSVEVVGTMLGSASAVFRLRVLLRGKVNCQTCTCPTVADVGERLGTFCVGSSTDTTISLSKKLAQLSLESGCIAEFTLASTSSPDFSPQQRFTVKGGDRFVDITTTVSPKTVGTFVYKAVYSITVRNLSTGKTETCTDQLVITDTADVITGSCQIVRTQVGPLRKCVYNDSSTVDSIEVRNTGRCPITINVSSKSGLFTVSPSGALPIPAGGRVFLFVRFNAQRRDWDANPMTPRGALGEKDFRGQIEITGCDLPSLVDVDGIATVQCNTFKYQCLRQFRPSGYQNVYAESMQLLEDKAQILYQNDNQKYQVFDVYVQDITQNGASYDVTLATGTNILGQSYGSFYLVQSNFVVQPGQSICDTYPMLAQTICTNAKSGSSSGSTTLSNLKQGDVVLFVKQGATGRQCALIWIQSVGPDRPGSVSLPQVCMEICYPVFSL